MVFTSHVNQATRVTSHSETSIDYIITNDRESEVKNVDLGLSDHNAQLLQLHNTITKTSSTQRQIYKRTFSTHQKLAFKNNLTQIDWKAVIDQNMDLEKNFQTFSQILLSAFEEHFPKKIFKPKRPKTKPWLTLGLKTSLVKKREMSFKAKTSTDLNFISYYKSYVKLLRKLIQISKKTCYDREMTKAENKSQAM